MKFSISIEFSWDKMLEDVVMNVKVRELIEPCRSQTGFQL